MKSDQWTAQPVSTPEVPGWLSSIFAQMVSMASLSACLRLLGAGVVTLSISLFLLQNWDTGNDIQRYLLLLAQTVMLAGTGLLTAHVLKEYKGARVFLLLALVASIANFAILGALTYSTVQWDSALGSYPAFSLWQAESFNAVMLTMLVAIIALAPTVYIAFRALSRNSAAPLGIAFMSSSALLLVPVREALPISMLIACSTILLLHAVKRMRINDPRLGAREGVISRALLFVPLGIMAGRGIYLYAADAITVTTFSAIVYLALRQMSMSLPASSMGRRTTDIMACLPLLGLAIGIPWIIGDLVGMPNGLYTPVFVLTAYGLVTEFSLRVSWCGQRGRGLAGIVMSVLLLANLGMALNGFAAASCLALGAVIAADGFAMKSRNLFACGLLDVLTGLAWLIYHAYLFFDFGNWAVLALGGMVTILVASTIERHGITIKSKLSRIQNRFNELH